MQPRASGQSISTCRRCSAEYLGETCPCTPVQQLGTIPDLGKPERLQARLGMPAGQGRLTCRPVRVAYHNLGLAHPAHICGSSVD